MSVRAAGPTRAMSVVFAALLLVYMPTLVGYVRSWSLQPYMHQGFLVALAVGVYLWKTRSLLRPRGDQPAAAAIFALGLSVAWLFATVANLQLVFLGLFPLIVLLWSLASLGSRAFRHLLPVAAFFTLAIPIWAFVERPLQIMTVLATGLILRLVRVPATIEGDFVHIAHGSFVIEDGCAGVNYLTSGLTIGILASQTTTTSARARWKIVASAAAISIVANWARVASLIGIGHVTEMQSPFVISSGPHVAFGWGIFAIAMVVFFVLVSRWTVRDRASAETSDREESATRAGPRAVAWTPMPAALVTVASFVGPFTYYGIGAIPARDSASDPIAPAGTTWLSDPAVTARPYTWQPRFPGAQTYAWQSWSNGDRQLVVDHGVYVRQAQGAELIGDGSYIAPDSLIVRSRSIRGVGIQPSIVNESIVRDGGELVLVWYWYRVGGIRAGLAYEVKLLEVVGFFRRATAVEVIAISTPCSMDDCTQAAKALEDFVRPAANVIAVPLSLLPRQPRAVRPDTCFDGQEAPAPPYDVQDGAHEAAAGQDCHRA